MLQSAVQYSSHFCHCGIYNSIHSTSHSNIDGKWLENFPDIVCVILSIEKLDKTKSCVYCLRVFGMIWEHGKIRYMNML